MIEKLWKILGGRKFLGFITGTALLIWSKITPDIWLWVFITYCTANVIKGAADKIDKIWPTKKG